MNERVTCFQFSPKPYEEGKQWRCLNETAGNKLYLLLEKGNPVSTTKRRCVLGKGVQPQALAHPPVTSSVLGSVRHSRIRGRQAPKHQRGLSSHLPTVSTPPLSLTNRSIAALVNANPHWPLSQFISAQQPEWLSCKANLIMSPPLWPNSSWEQNHLKV